MKIAVIADAHANLPALQAALDAIRGEGCDAIYLVGDAIAIGPYPAECVDLLCSTPNLHCTLGNHELYCVRSKTNPLPAKLSAGEVQHQRWTHSQLDDRRKALIARWPLVIEAVFAGVKTVFMHYGLTPSGEVFSSVVRSPNAADLDGVFARQEADLIFFGHDHLPYDVLGKRRYINPGSLGCSREALARYVVAIFKRGAVRVQAHSVPYADGDLYAAFENRDVPERAFIYRVFYGGRFGG